MELLGIRTVAFVQAYATVIARRVTATRKQERGEGVISAALVVLIIAFLAVAMWAAYQKLFAHAAEVTTKQVDLIGQ